MHTWEKAYSESEMVVIPMISSHSSSVTSRFAGTVMGFVGLGKKA